MRPVLVAHHGDHRDAAEGGIAPLLIDFAHDRCLAAWGMTTETGASVVTLR
jgi:hypothetical protein